MKITAPHQRKYKITYQILLWITDELMAATAAEDLATRWKNERENRGWFLSEFFFWNRLLFLFFIPFFTQSFLGSLSMFFNYLKIAFRNIKNHKGFSLINVSGLAVGITCCMLILLWVQDEISFDNFHKKKDSIYRVLNVSEKGTGKPYSVTPAPLAQRLKSDYPEIIDATHLELMQQNLKAEQKTFGDNIILFTDPSFLNIFTFPLATGDLSTALENPNSIILSRPLALKLFGTEDVLGKNVNIEGKHDLIVTGILNRIPHNSHLQFDCIVPFSLVKDFNYYFSYNQTNWGFNSFATYILLGPNVDPVDIGNKIYDLYEKVDPRVQSKPILQPLKKIHLYSPDFESFSPVAGDIKYIYIFTLVAFLVLVSACINFMNMSIARSTSRAKEICIRKVIGAKKHQLIRQHFGDAFLMVFLSLLASIILVSAAFPSFNRFTGKNLAIDHFLLGWFPGLLLGTILFSGFVSGFYPAMILSSFSPARIIRGSQSTIARNPVFRKILVGFQFSLSAILIIFTLGINRQINYMKKKNLGFNKENILNFYSGDHLQNKGLTFKNEILGHSGIESLSATNFFSGAMPQTLFSKWEGNTENKIINISFANVDYDTLDLFKLRMKQGRYFSPEHATDQLEIVVNETAVNAMGMTDPLGKWVDLGQKMKIIGVVEDFNVRSLHSQIMPYFIYLFPAEYRYFNIKLTPGFSKETLTFIEEKWKEFIPNAPFSFRFLDEMLISRYSTEEKLEVLFNSFTGLAIFIAGLGLLGLAVFSTQHRTKEIGIRKILGARTLGLLVKLYREFSLTIVIANIIAWPTAYFILKKWLENFAYKSTVTPIIFFASLGLCIGITLLTTGYLCLKTSRANPVESLRYE